MAAIKVAVITAAPQVSERRTFVDCWCKIFFTEARCPASHPTNSIKQGSCAGLEFKASKSP